MPKARAVATEIELGEAAVAPAPEAPPPVLEVPDLALAPRTQPRPVRPSPIAPTPAIAPSPSESASKVPSFAPPPMKPAARKPAAPGQVTAGSFDEMDMMSNDFGSIDLEGESGRQPNGKAKTESVAPAAVAPTGMTLLLSEDGGRAAAVRLGAYGDVPDAWWKTPAYAYRVKMRQLELRRILAARRETLTAAQSATDDILVGLAERGRRLLSQKDSYSKLLGAVISAEHALRERDSALAAETDVHRQKTAGLDARIALLEAELAGAKAEEQACDDVFARVDAIRQRADAKVKRVDIELRSALARAMPAGVPGAGGMTEEINAAVAARTAERDARLAEIEQAMPAVVEATQKLAVARRKSTAVEHTVLVAKNERAAMEANFRKRGAAHGAEVARAQKEVRAAMALLGRTAAADSSTFGAEWSDARRQLVALDQTTAARDDDVMLHVMALDACDPAKVRTGIGLILGGLGLLIVLALLPLAIRLATPAPPVSVTIPMP